MPLFRKRKDSKSDKQSKDPAKTSPPPSASYPRKPSVPYRHLPTRAAHDARELKLPRLSLDTKNLNMHTDLRPIQSAPSPVSAAGGRFFSAKDRLWAREHTSPRDKSSPISPTGKLPLREKPSSRDNASPNDTLSSPQDGHSPAPYRHIPTHAATDAFRTSAGTQAGWHRTRINRLEDHSKRLSIALTKPGIRRFGSSSSSSSSSAASIDSILCAACSSSGKTLNRKCSQQHLKPQSTHSDKTHSDKSTNPSPSGPVNVAAVPGPSVFPRAAESPTRPSQPARPKRNSSENQNLDSISEDEAIIKVANLTTFHRIRIDVR